MRNFVFFAVIPYEDSLKLFPGGEDDTVPHEVVGLVINPGSFGVLPMPLPGTYQLSVTDETGSFDVIDVEVISLD